MHQVTDHMTVCDECAGAGEITLPVRGTDETDLYPCPCCRRWKGGFPGLYVGTGSSRRCLIAPYDAVGGE